MVTRSRNADGSLSALVRPAPAVSSGTSPFNGGARLNNRDEQQARIESKLGSNSTGQVSFTGDSTYNDQANALSRAAADYAANINAQRQQATQQYDWSKEDLNRQSGENQYNQVNDFAGRGLLNSGLYAKAEDDRQAGVTRQAQAMAMGLQNQLNGYNQDLSSFNSENAIALNRAKADAIARQAAKIGIG